MKHLPQILRCKATGWLCVIIWNLCSLLRTCCNDSMKRRNGAGFQHLMCSLVQKAEWNNCSPCRWCSAGTPSSALTAVTTWLWLTAAQRFNRCVPGPIWQAGDLKQEEVDKRSPFAARKLSTWHVAVLSRGMKEDVESCPVSVSVCCSGLQSLMDRGWCTCQHLHHTSTSDEEARSSST